MERVRRIPPLLLVAASVAACNLDPSTGDPPVPGPIGAVCASVADCQEGLACREGLCALPSQVLPPDDAAFLRDYAAKLEELAGLTEDAFLDEYVPPREYLSPTGLSPAGATGFDRVDTALALTDDQEDVLRDHGFVVLANTAAPNSAAAYRRVYEADLPVVITVDSVLEALHMSYDTLLKRTEVDRLIPAADELLVGLQNGLRDRVEDPAHAAFSHNLDDLDVYVGVALSLLRGEPAPTVRPGNAAAVAELLAAVEREQKETVPLFGGERELDFSQFHPRGHYDCTDAYGYGCPQLAHYFRAFIWLGRTEFRLDDAPGEDVDRQLVDAFLLQQMLHASAWEPWADLEAVLSRFVGQSDNLDPKGMDRLIGDAAILSAADLAARLPEIRALISTKGYGEQKICSQLLMTDPFDPNVTPIPKAYLLLGQRYVLDSHVFSNVVYDRIVYNGEKINRQLPDPLDAAYAAFGNDAAAPLLETELRAYHYQGNLAALRYLADAHAPDFWGANVYHGWLDALRTLSEDSSGPAFPAVMRTEAWTRRILNTQLASWAQLRHDNLLYAKQSYTGEGCSYPDAYVEPYPAFFARLADLARDTEASMAEVELPVVAGYFRRFGGVMDSLEAAALHVSAGEPLDADDLAFLTSVITLKEETICGDVDFEGWLLDITFTDDPAAEFSEFKPVVADVHTAPDPGQVLHVGTGHVRLMVADFGTPAGEAIYVGPVLSYYERVEEGMNRLTDAEWKTLVNGGEASPPEWVSDLVR